MKLSEELRRLRKQNRYSQKFVSEKTNGTPAGVPFMHGGAEREGFEPSIPLKGIHDFQDCFPSCIAPYRPAKTID